MFDHEFDQEMRANIEAERQRLITLAQAEESNPTNRGRGRGGAAVTSEETVDDKFTPNPVAPEFTYRPSMLPDPGPIAIVGATVHTISGEDIENGVVVLSLIHI